MSLMKLRRNRKGFTLIEMMIVIAVIAILAAVIIPKSGIVQKSAKESGVEANMRVVQGILENQMPRFDGATRGTELAAALVTRLANDVKNPVTNGTDVYTTDEPTDATAVAVVYADNLTGDNKAGVVHVSIPELYSNANKIKINGYDSNGNIMKGAEIELP